MNRFIFTFLLFLLSIYTVSVTASDTEHSEDDELELIQIIDGQAVIFLDDDIQESSGLEVLTLKQVEFQTEFITYGKAINPSPLLSIRNQYLAASAQQTGARARLTQAGKNISRLRNLHKNEVISTKKLQQQQSQWQSDKANYNANDYQAQLIINNSHVQWGKTLTQWLTTNHSKQFDQLINGEITLLQVTQPAKSSIPFQANTIYINPTGNRSLAFAATFISQLPRVDSLSQGRQYIFQTDNPAIRAGMNFTAWIPQQAKKQSGVIIPEPSLVWYLGQAFVFIKVDEEHFAHRNISNPIKVASGYFIADQITDSEVIVVKGAQMLLSHEFRSQIPDEDDDD